MYAIRSYYVLQETATYASEVEATAFKRVLPTRIDVVTPNLGAVKAAATSTAYDGMVLTEWLQKLRDADVDRTWRAVQRGITQGATTDEIVKSVVGTKKLRYKDGVRNVTRNGAKMMVRTLLTGAANVGRQALWEENAHLIKCIMWVSTLDGKTSDICP